MRSVTYSCEEHVEEALDDWIYGEETFPEFEKLENVTNMCITCGYCKSRAIYMVGNECSDTKYRK
ncbi:CxxH/CxxC protein [Listeria riparia]|uniref:CxxH/CxxC protein n=1 Tax=Listeria riparia TaxID=1494964 RepID=UPI000568B7F7